MPEKVERKTIEIDATNKAIGRIAATAAKILQGKNKASYVPRIDSGDFVIIHNVSKVSFTGQKLEQKDYYHHTMHPGGIKRTPMKKLFIEKPAEVMKKAIYGMLPKNRMREHMMQRLTINA